MSLFLQSPVSAGVVAAFCAAGLVDIGSTNVIGGLLGGDLRYSATLIGACPFLDGRNFSLSSRRRPEPNLT